MKKRSTKLKWIGVTLASLGALASSSNAMAHVHSHKGMRAESDGGILVYSGNDCNDCPYWFQLGGRLAFDETFFAGGWQDRRDDFPTGANIRYARLMFRGGVGDYLTYNLTLNFNHSQLNGDAVSSNGTSVDFEDAWLNACSSDLGVIDKADIRVGQFTPPTSIDDWTRYGTENDTFLLEPALETTAFLRPMKALGVWADASAFDMFVLSTAVYQPRQNNTNQANNVNSVNNYFNAGRSDRLGTAGRLTFVPVHTDCMVYHLGILGRYQSMNNVRSGVPVFQPNLFRTGPEARARNTAELANTGAIRARSYNVVSGEALAMWGPAWIEGEYHRADVQRVPTITVSSTRDNPEFHGWHLQGGYMLTGESRVYDYMTGTLRNPSPAERCGAWEIVARYSYVNLADRDIQGGSEHNTSVGVNWFVNDNVRIAANYIRADIHPNAVAAVPVGTKAERELDIFALRFGIEF